MSFRNPRGPHGPRLAEPYLDDETDPGRLFGERSPSRQRDRKLLQLCRQVERAAAFSLGEIADGDALQGATVAAVAAAPDAGRLRIVVVLAAGKTNVEATAAGAALRRLAPAFRAEVARAVNRKRAPELVFDVRLESEVADV